MSTGRLRREAGSPIMYVRAAIVPSEERKGEVMDAKCERCQTVFEADVREDPRGRKYVVCPLCRRAYYLQEDGTWKSDRLLTIVEKGENDGN